MKNGKLLVLLTFILILVLPAVGAYLQWGGMPPGYGYFPAQKVMECPPLNETYFLLASCCAVLILAFLFFPHLFGFKKAHVNNKPAPIAVGFPAWFYPSLLVTLVSWFLMWCPWEIARPLNHYTFVPLWWGFILVLDSFVYVRNGGKSLVATNMPLLKLLAVVSSFSWFVFEYLNFFVIENWYYPNQQIFTNFGNISWQLLSYTTVLPAIFEWYFLLKTFQGIDEYYKYGPKIVLSPPLLIIGLVLGLLLLFFMGYFPFLLFWVLWVSLIPALVPAMFIAKQWTPFTPISEKGDWSFVVLIALATLLNGFFWELWNFGSGWFNNYAATNPNYWKYAVPYLDKYHFFSEMPILGYFGYLFFGNVCWMLWVAIGYLMDFDATMEITPYEEKEKP
ncbi:MAG: small-conductance mechanosensitive channel [Bacteroidetes bacterium]|nr:MAG: small-conductance mechanosensitive channel [Bacteroidota bacterium]